MTVNSPDLPLELKGGSMPKQFTEKDAIRNLQTYLRRLSYINDDAIKSPIDGIFESSTQNALRQFQRNNDLPVTGVADRATWDVLYAQYLNELKRLALPDPIIPFPSYPSDYKVASGEESFLVSIIQYMLKELSIIYDTFDAVEITGKYDQITKDAISDFQKRNGLSDTGDVDKETWNALSRIYNLSLHHIEQK